MAQVYERILQMNFFRVDLGAILQSIDDELASSEDNSDLKGFWGEYHTLYPSMIQKIGRGLRKKSECS